MKKGSLSSGLKLTVPASDWGSFSTKFLSESESETFKAVDLLVDKEGVRVVSEKEEEAPPPITPLDNQLNLADIDTIKVIGKGNGGIVQLVQHKWTNQFFALKEIHMNIEEPIQRQIALELKINQSAQCPYVVVCYQSSYHNGVISIIFEYMDGGSLEDLLNKVQKIPESYLAAICKQVLNGLMYLHHEKYIIHRDLKPSNLLINHRGEVKITDFGVSIIMENTSGQANTFIGTHSYMSPERITSNQNGYDYKSDIWSLGLILLKCATGQFPYTPPDQREGWENIFQLIEVIVEKPSPTAPPEDFSPEFCSFISACLQKNPRDRPSARDLINHPFIKLYEDLNVDLSTYFYNAGSTLATI
ncbi:mitogen-activated protein kinase kinase 2-like isoform X2 [Vigna unguiculata]|uniref:mitogen-activated protein kinase kinase n=1 Tax=Vigna unguiculata TaxID=3917 RepID=A0A4D6NKS6_VIGUN|nr:mitogen-activated protein kinase kinase 2-like isoform X2 [Vigna unguiculata]QCE13541.1 mitogen-activated protein kinase kinase 1 [Vigna unguiculata]